MPACRAVRALLLLLLLLLLLAPAGALFINIRDPPYSAVGDGVHDDTLPLRAALAALASSATGGTLLLPAPYTFLSQALNLSANLDLEVAGTLLAAPGGPLWPLIPPLPWFGGGVDAPESGAPEWQPFLLGLYAHNLTIRGGGVVDGGGGPWWACAHGAPPLQAPPCSGFSRPRLLQPRHARGFALRGLTLRNSPAWTIDLENVSDARLADFAVLAPADQGNTDGVDVTCSQRVAIENFVYRGGDDAVAVKAGLGWLGRAFGLRTEDVLVRNMSVLSGNGFAVGSEMSAGVRNVTFANITVQCLPTSPCKHGLYIKTARGRGGLVEGVSAVDVVVGGGVALGHGITLDYTRPQPPPTNASATPAVRGVTFSGGSIASPVAFSLQGLPESAVEGLLVQGVALARGTRAASACANASGVCRGMAPGACPPCLTAEASAASGGGGVIACKK